MSAVDKYKKMITDESEETQNTVTNSGRKSFQEERTDTINILYSRLRIMKQECEYLSARTNEKTKKAFDAKGKAWAMVITGTENLKKLYK